MNDRIKMVRKEAGLSQEEFAKRLGLTKNFVSLIETEKRAPSDRTIIDICREFNVNEDWLRTGEGEMLRTLDRDEEIAQIVQTLYKEEEDSFKLRLIRVLCAMEEDDWKFMENLLDEIMAKKKGQAEAQP